MVFLQWEDVIMMDETVHRSIDLNQCPIEFNKNDLYINPAGLIDMSFGGQRANNQFAQHFIR